MKPERIADPDRPNCWMCGRVREVIIVLRRAAEKGFDPEHPQYPIRICNICDRA